MEQIKISEMPLASLANLSELAKDPNFPIILKSDTGDYYNYRITSLIFALHIANIVAAKKYVSESELTNIINDLNLGNYITAALVQTLLNNLNLSLYAKSTDLTELKNKIISEVSYLIDDIDPSNINYNVINAFTTTSSSVGNFETSYKTSTSNPPSGWVSNVYQLDTTLDSYIWQISARQTSSGYYNWLDGTIWTTASCIGKITKATKDSSNSGSGSESSSTTNTSTTSSNYRVRNVTIYADLENKPNTPATTYGTYDWDNDKLILPAGTNWSTSYSDSPNYSIWQTSKTFYEDSSHSVESWSPVLLLILSADDLLKKVVTTNKNKVTLYALSATAPKVPTGTSYNFDTDTLSISINFIGTWKTTAGDFDLSNPIWVTYNTFLSDGSNTGWSDPVKMFDFEALLKTASEEAYNQAELALSDAETDIETAKNYLEEAKTNVAQIYEGLTVLYKWQTATPESGVVSSDLITTFETAPTTEDELNEYTGLEYFNKWYKLNDTWYKYFAYDLDLTNYLTAINNNTLNISKLLQTTNSINLAVSSAKLDNVTWTYLSPSFIETYKSENIHYTDTIEEGTYSTLTYLKEAYKNVAITSIPFGRIFTLKDGTSYRADYPATTSFMKLIPNEIKLGVTNTNGLGALIGLLATDDTSKITLSSEHIVLDGNTIASALYAESLDIYKTNSVAKNGIRDIDTNTIVTHLDSDGSAWFGQKSVYFDTEGNGFVGKGSIMWGLFTLTDGLPVWDETTNAYITNDSNPYALIVKGTVNAYAGLIGGWTIAGGSNGSTINDAYLTATSDNILLYNDGSNDIYGSTRLSLTPTQIINTCKPTGGSEYEAYALYSSGKAEFAKQHVLFNSDGSGFIGNPNSENESESISWDSDGNITFGSNVLMKWNSQNIPSLTEDSVKSIMKTAFEDDSYTTNIDWEHILTKWVVAYSGTFTGDVSAKSFSVINSEATPIMLLTTYDPSTIILPEGTALPTGITTGTPIIVITDTKNNLKFILNMLALESTSTITNIIALYTGLWKWDKTNTKALSDYVSISPGNYILYGTGNGVPPYLYGLLGDLPIEIPTAAEAGGPQFYVAKSGTQQIPMAIRISGSSSTYSYNGKYCYMLVTCTKYTLYRAKNNDMQIDNFYISWDGIPYATIYQQTNYMQAAMTNSPVMLTINAGKNTFGDDSYVNSYLNVMYIDCGTIINNSSFKGPLAEMHSINVSDYTDGYVTSISGMTLSTFLTNCGKYLNSVDWGTPVNK